MSKFTKENFSITPNDDFLKENEEYPTLVHYANNYIPPPTDAYDILYIFCPSQSIVLIDKMLSGYPLHPVFNNCSRIFRKDEKITYYNAGHLTDASREFLLKNIENGVEVMPLVDFLENKNRFTEVSLLNGDYFLTKEDFSVLRNKTKIATKRIFDIIYTLILLVVFAPVMILTAIAIKLESKGPIFYRQRRVGLYNIEFEVIKFRSMATNAEANGAQWASKNDPRVTKVGKFIRKTRIDEMPQLFNILKGEMSLIGPRPERQVFIDRLKTAIPYYEFRHVIKPGLTGWAQVKYPYGASIEDGMWKHKYDMYYIKHQSFWFDFKIILQTVKVVFSGLGR